MNANSQFVISGRSINTNSDRNVSVTTDNTEENALPAMPSTVVATRGTSLARVDRSESIDRSLTCDKSGFSVGLAASWFQ